MSSGLSSKSGTSGHWASIRKRPRANGSTAYLVLYERDGKQGGITFDDPGQAEAMVALVRAHGPNRALEMHGLDPAPRQRETAGQTVEQFLDEHIGALSGIEKKTVAEYRRYLTRDIAPTLGPIPLTGLVRTDISKWVNKLREDGASGKTIQNKIGFLSGALNSAVRDGHLPANPAAGIRLPRTVRREMQILSVAEFNLLKGTFTERWHPLLDLLVTSGCRFSEATALTPSDVDTAQGTIRIRQAWKRIPDGDGDRYELGQPKTRRSNRTIKIPASVLDNLDLTGEWVFTGTRGGPVRIYSWRSNVWTKSLEKAKTVDPDDPDKPVLTKSIRIHDLRHTAASWLLGAGVPLIEVSAHLGHEDTSVTSKIYGHLMPGVGSAAADAMTKLLIPSSAS